MTLVMLAHHFLVLERGKGGKKGAGLHGRRDRQSPPRAAGTRKRTARTTLRADSLSHPRETSSAGVPLPNTTPEAATQRGGVRAVSDVA
jgi:hypothetical protein